LISVERDATLVLLLMHWAADDDRCLTTESEHDTSLSYTRGPAAAP